MRNYLFYLTSDVFHLCIYEIQLRDMALEEKHFKEICERCENHATNMTCEDKMTCPAYKLYCLATSDKKRTVVIKYDDWKEPPQPPTGII